MTFPFKLPRLTFTLLITALLLVLIAQIAPQQLPVSLYKLSLVMLAAFAGYWLDRELFPYSRPDSFLDADGCLGDREATFAFAAAQIRRALVIAAAMIAISLGA